jgi:hypothetical protein
MTPLKIYAQVKGDCGIAVQSLVLLIFIHAGSLRDIDLTKRNEYRNMP